MSCPRFCRAGVFIAATATLVATASAAPSFDKDIEPILAEFCYDCHGDGVDKGDLELDGDTSAAHILKNRAVWETVLYNVENWVMPPPDRKKQPTQTQRDTLVAYLDNLLFYCDCDNPDPGRVTIRRLNREEYNNTTRDLIGIEQRPADEFPADDTGYGFDTIGDVLSLPPILMERYLMAADKLLDAAIVAGPPESSKRTYKPSLLLRACPTSSGRACPTTNSSPWRSTTNSANNSTLRSTGCSPTRSRVSWRKTSPGSGWSSVTSSSINPTPPHSPATRPSSPPILSARPKSSSTTSFSKTVPSSSFSMPTIPSSTPAWLRTTGSPGSPGAASNRSRSKAPSAAVSSPTAAL